MRCEQARQLFDAYLNGELSPGLTTELGAHRLRCPECRRTLALLEVSGHILASDRDSVALRSDFTDRLMACMQSPRGGWFVRYRRAMYVAGPLAAAAVVALAFLGVFDRSSGGPVLSDVQVRPSSAPGSQARPPRQPATHDEGQLTIPEDGNEGLLEAWVQDMRKNMDAKRQSGESLQKAFDLTVEQLLDILREAEQAPRVGPDATPDNGVPVPVDPSESDAAGDEEVEDL